jgi:hypothetical protein
MHILTNSVYYEVILTATEHDVFRLHYGYPRRVSYSSVVAMWRKKNFPKNSASHLDNEKFLPSLLLIASYSAQLYVLVFFIISVAEGTRFQSINETIISLLLTILIIAVSLPLTILAGKKSWVQLNTDGVVLGQNANLFPHKKASIIKWHDITAVKAYNILGVKTLSIETNHDNPWLRLINTFTPGVYRGDRLLAKVQELAGADHVLARALERELPRSGLNLKERWAMTIGLIAVTTSIWLIGGNMYAAQQEKPIEQAITSYVRQNPTTPPNQSAIELQSLISKLGLSMRAFGDGSAVKVQPTKAAIAEWKAIEPVLTAYSSKTEADLQKIPDQLVRYLQQHQQDIEAIEEQLAKGAVPMWGSDSRWLAKYDHSAPPTNLLSLLSVNDVIITNIINKYQSPNAVITQDLLALERLVQSLQSEPSLYGQAVARICEKRVSKLFRLVNAIPNTWGNTLFETNRQKRLAKLLSLSGTYGYSMVHDDRAFAQLLESYNLPLRHVPGYVQLVKPQVRLEIVNYHYATLKELSFWQHNPICQINSGNTAPIYNWNILKATDSIPSTYARNYLHLQRRDLSWELSKSIRQVSDRLRAGQAATTVAQKFSQSSQTCPGEKWTATATNDKVIIAFSHALDWNALGVHPKDVDPTTYEIKLADLQPAK